jgi:hypothetical protein
MVALERAMSGQMTHDLAVTAHENLAAVHALLFDGQSANKAAATALGRRRA